MRISKSGIMKLKTVSLLCVGSVLLCGILACSNQAKLSTEENNDEQHMFIGDNIAVAQTQYGKVKGFILKGIYNFRGVPYGASTAGENRFMPPREPEPWEGIRPAVFWGDTAPQKTKGKYRNSYSTLVDHWNYYDVSEDCLMLNIWTPGLTDNKKRPVLVWLHGGGFTNGNGIEQDGYNGENISRYGDIVFVSINLRLGPIGFSDLSVAGKGFEASGNVGILDLVAGLKWVHNNIGQFGGDTDNVTINEQTGGGSNVSTLVAMPETQGLIHKAIALSGNSADAIDKNYSAAVGKVILQEAGLKPSEANKLQQMPWLDYIELANRAMAKYNEQAGITGRRSNLGPIAGGTHIPMGGFFTNPSAPSANIPMIFCTTNCEFSLSRDNSTLEQIDKKQLVEMINQMKGGNGDKIVDAYAKAFPDKKPIELLGLILSSRENVIATANQKLTQKAPVYLAWFGWNPPLFDGRMRAFHCLDICFWLKNTDLMITHTGGGKRPRDLSMKMTDALLNFMRIGNPNCAGLPEWPQYTAEKGATMMLNDVCEVVYDPDREARESLK